MENESSNNAFRLVITLLYAYIYSRVNICVIYYNNYIYSIIRMWKYDVATWFEEKIKVSFPVKT